MIVCPVEELTGGLSSTRDAAVTLGPGFKLSHWGPDVVSRLKDKPGMRLHLLSGDFGLLGHSLSQPGHGAGEGHCHADPHTVGALPLVHHGHIQGPGKHNAPRQEASPELQPRAPPPTLTAAPYRV